MATQLRKSLRPAAAATFLLSGALTGMMFEGTPAASAASVVIQTINVGDGPYSVSSDGTHVWVANQNGNTVSEIDASTGGVIQTIPVGMSPYDVSSDGTHVWVANGNDSTVTELNAATGAVIR